MAPSYHRQSVTEHATTSTPIIWCATLKEFERIAADLRAIPILVPGTEVEQTRRADILREICAESQPGGEPPQPGDVIITLDEMAERSLRPFAARQGRPLHSVRAFRDVLPFAEAADTRSVLVCGHPSSLPAEQIMELNATVQIPWGIFTGLDEADLTFLAAKTLLTPSHSNGRHAGVYSTKYIYMLSAEDGSQGYEPYDAAAVKRLLVEQRHDSLTLEAHGGAGHLCLGQVRICNPSQFNFIEEGDARHVCATRGASQCCRRNSDPDTVTLSCGDIRASSLTVFACSMVTQHQGMYASDLSAFLSVARGYPSAIITTDQLIAVPQSALELSARLAAAGISAGWRVRLMNDLYLRQRGAAPLLLMGDPRGSRPRSGEPLRSRTDGPLAVSVCFLPPDVQPQPRIIAPQASEATLLRGRSHLTVLGGEPGVRDMTEVFGEAERWFVVLGQRMQEAVRLEQILGLIYRQEHPETEEEPLFSQLTEIRMGLEPLMTTALLLLQRCEATGTWDEAVHILRDACAASVREWDGVCATLVKNYLMSRSMLSSLALGWRLESRQGGDEPCAFCGAATVVERYSDWIGGNTHATACNCPRCGELAFWTDRLGPVRVNVEPTIQSGHHNRVGFALLPSGYELVEHGSLIWMLLDAGVKKIKVRQQMQYVVGAEVECGFEDEFTPDIHELSFVAVKDMSLSAGFRSWPAVTP